MLLQLWQRRRTHLAQLHQPDQVCLVRRSQPHLEGLHPPSLVKLVPGGCLPGARTSPALPPSGRRLAGSPRSCNLAASLRLRRSCLRPRQALLHGVLSAWVFHGVRSSAPSLRGAWPGRLFRCPSPRRPHRSPKRPCSFWWMIRSTAASWRQTLIFVLWRMISLARSWSPLWVLGRPRISPRRRWQLWRSLSSCRWICRSGATSRRISLSSATLWICGIDALPGPHQLAAVRPALLVMVSAVRSHGHLHALPGAVGSSGCACQLLD